MTGSRRALAARRPRLRRRGVSSIKIILALPALIMFTWLGAEVGLVLRAANQAKIAADAIALAAAARFDAGFETARLDALEAAAANRAPKGPVAIEIGDGPDGGGDLVFGRWNADARAFEADPRGGPAVRATVRFGADNPNGAPGLVFAALFGLADVAVERTSVAVFNPPRHTTALEILGSGSSRLRMNGTAALSSSHGVSVVSDSAHAVRLENDSSISAPILRIAGGIDADSVSRVDGVVEQQADVAGDPFAGAMLPPINAGSARPISTVEGATIFVAPGVHQGLEMQAGEVVLLPGLHQFVGAIQLGGTARLKLDAATIQLGGGVDLTLSESSSISGDPASQIGAWSGFSVIQRSNQAQWRMAGTARASLQGTIYAPQTRVRVLGSSTMSAGSAVFERIEAFDNARVELSGKIDELDLPPTPGRARLVR